MPWPLTYGFGEAESGLALLPSGLGMVIAVLLFGQLTDLVVLRHKARETVYKLEVRLIPQLTIPSGLALPVGLLVYGWATVSHKHWIVLMIGVSIFTIGMMDITVYNSMRYTFSAVLPPSLLTQGLVGVPSKLPS